MSTTAVQLLTIPETAAALRCSRDHVYDLISGGHLRQVDIGGGRRSKTRVRVEDLAAYIDRRTQRRKP